MTDGEPVYHVELRAFPHLARVFNLDRAMLDERFVRPWVNGELIEHDDRRWAPEKTKLTVLVGPAVAESGLGLGRGWGEVTRHAEDVTETVLAEIQRGAEARPDVETLKGALAEVAAGTDGIGFPDAIALAAAAHPGWRASEQLSLAEQAVWEMLHRGELAMRDGNGRPIAAAGWQDVVLSWATWASGLDGSPVRLHAGGDGRGAGEG
jgi:hypothetical protein